MEQACRARELKGGLLYVLYLCNQRDMLMLFFSFSVARGSETGLGEGGGQREGGAEFGPFWVPGKPFALLSHLPGVDSGKCPPPPG